jgi:hypothetical protein
MVMEICMGRVQEFVSTGKRLTPTSVIRTRATSSVMRLARTRPLVAVASPALTSSTICSTVKPCRA